MLLGALTNQMDDLKLLDPQPTAPFIGFSALEFAKSLHKIFTPQWTSDGRYDSHSRSQTNTCKLENHLRPIIEDLESHMKGFTLEQYMDADFSHG
jgi:hypothetical protein